MLISCHQDMHFITECCHLLLECFNLLELTLIQEVAPPFSINPPFINYFFHYSCLCVLTLVFECFSLTGRKNILNTLLILNKLLFDRIRRGFR